MTEKRTSIFENGLIWFGAGVSLAEILTGTYFAPLGFQKGLLAIIIGHLIGCTMLFLAGVIGGKTRRSAMETVKMSFGEKGGIFFSFLNVLQLVGWTAIMIYDGALAADGVLHTGSWVWCLVIGALIVLWIFIGITNLGKINTIAMAALFILTLVLCKLIFFDGGTALAIGEEAMSFGAAVELSVAMPLSWLPLISDYTREAKEPVKATAVSAIIYGLVSCWMYVIGMGAAIYTGESDIAQIMVKAGLGIAGLLIIVFSTVTTTFLDAYSAGISSESVFSRINGKYAAIAVTVIVTIGAIVYPMDNITDFLYLIGSVFAPMIAIQIADFFLLKRADSLGEAVDITNAVIWVIGFILYRILMRIDIPVGNTLPDMVITILICMAARNVFKEKKFINQPIPCSNKHESPQRKNSEGFRFGLSKRIVFTPCIGTRHALIFVFLQRHFHNCIPGIWEGVAVAGVCVKEEKLVLGVFFQIPVVCQANFGIVADAAESFNLSVDSGEGNGSCLGFHNVGVDLAAIAGVAAPFRLVNSGVAAAVNTLGVLVHPLAHFFQNLHGFLWNTAFGIRAYVQKKVAAFADALNQHMNDHLR